MYVTLTHVHTRTHTHTHSYTIACLHTHVYAYPTLAWSHSHVCTPHAHTPIRKHILTLMHMQVCSQHMHTHAHTHAHGHTLTLRVIMTSCSDVSLLGAKTWERSSYLPHLYHPREKGLLWARPALREHSPCSRLKDVPLRTGQDFSSQGETLSFTRCKLSAALAGRHG